jgi:sugar phosphate isomerase/epimerase
MKPLITRRQFLERATTVTAVLLAARPVWAADGMFVSLNGSLTPGVSGADRARLAAKLGYGGVDWDFGPAKKAGAEETAALFKELKIRPTIVSLPLQQPFGGDDAEFKGKLPQLVEDAAFCSAIGCDKMMLVLSPAAPLPKDEQRKLVVDRLAAVSEILRKSKIRLGLEFLGPLYMRTGPGRGGEPRHPFIWTLPETVALAKDVGPNIGAILDVWHWYHSGGTVADILATDQSRIVHLHLSDAQERPAEEVRDNQRFMPGEGIVNLTGFLQALKKIGYQDGVSPEPLGRIPKEMPPEEAARLGLATTQAALKKAGVNILNS